MVGFNPHFPTIYPLPLAHKTKTMAKSTKIEITKEEPSVSPTKAAFAKLIEDYKKQNPVKFAAKKARLEAKLAELS